MPLASTSALPFAVSAVLAGAICANAGAASRKSAITLKPIFFMAVSPWFAAGPSQRLLLMSAFLAGVFDAGLSTRRLDAVHGAALSAVGLDARVALFHRDRFALQRLAHETFGFLAHRLLRHRVPVRLSTFIRRHLLAEPRGKRTTRQDGRRPPAAAS